MLSENLLSAETALKDLFGLKEFRPGQKTLIGAILEGRDVIGILPTGAGKSLIYQLPAFIMPGLTLVISPLIALMTDQVRSLKQKGLEAEALHSAMSGYEKQQVIEKVLNGNCHLLYLSPERFTSSAFRDRLSEMTVSLVCIDEAHCLSAWGDDFRPSYRQIGEVLRHWPSRETGRPPVCALTASATPAVREDIINSLGLISPCRLSLSFDRPNLFFGVVPAEDKLASVTAILPYYKNKCGIIYCQTRQSVDALTRFLKRRGCDVLPYHAGLDKETRQKNQEAWLRGDVPVMVATNAFGMGIDRPDVRFVIHFQMPGSMECYYQEAGRAGRDGKASDCLLLFSRGDIAIQDSFVLASLRETGKPDGKKKDLRKKQSDKKTAGIHTMMGYISGETCLRSYILTTFGEVPENSCCGYCSVCLANKKAALSLSKEPLSDRSDDLLRRSDTYKDLSEDPALYRHLKSLRSRLIRTEKKSLTGKPLIPLFPESVLHELAAIKPVTWTGLLTVPDISLIQALKWGRPFLTEIRLWNRASLFTPRDRKLREQRSSRARRLFHR